MRKAEVVSMHHGGQMRRSFISPAGNVKIFYRTFQARVERARLIIAHGMGDHSGRYANVVEAGLSCGVSVLALDLRGHGRSRGRRGHVLSFDEYVTDLHVFVKKVQATTRNGSKVFLLGQGMGGIVALLYGARHPMAVDGLIVSSPLMRATDRIPAWKIRLGTIASLLSVPVSMNSGIDARSLSRDPAAVYEYTHDSLVHQRVTAQWLKAFAAAMDRTSQEAARIEIPVLVQAGTGDRLVVMDSVRKIFANLNAADKSLLTYPGCYHEIYNEQEPDRSRIIADLFAWLENHL